MPHMKGMKSYGGSKAMYDMMTKKEKGKKKKAKKRAKKR